MIITDDLGGVWGGISEKLGEAGKISEKLGEAGKISEKLGEARRISEVGGRLQIVFGGRLQNAPT